MNLKTAYRISFWFGVVYLAFQLLQIPAMIFLYSSMGVRYTQVAEIISTNSLYQNLIYFGGFIVGILIGVLIIGISRSLIHGKTAPNRMIQIGATVISVCAVIVGLLFVFAVITAFAASSLQEMYMVTMSVSNFLKPALGTVFLLAVVLFTAGYIEEKIKSAPRNYAQSVFPTVAIVVVIFLDLVRLFG